MILRLLVLLAVLWAVPSVFAQRSRQIQPYVAPHKLYALNKPAGWRVTETAQSDFLRVLVSSPDGFSAVDFAWSRNDQGRPNALHFLLLYRRLLGRSYPDVNFAEIHASRDNLRAGAAVTFHSGGGAVKGRYYFEAGPRGLSAQGYFAPEGRLASERVLLLNVMASLAFIKRDERPPSSGAEPAFYRPRLVQRVAQDRSMSIRIPEDWEFMAAGGKVVTGARGGPGFIFTSLQGTPLAPNATVAQGIIASRYLSPPQTLTWLLRAFGHQDVRIDSSQPDPATTRELSARIRHQSDAQDVVARWTSAGGGARTVGAFKVMNSLPSLTGQWFTIVSGAWAPEKDSHLYIPALEEVAASFSINDQYAREYIRAGLARLRELQKQTAAAMGDLNRAREQNQRDWEERQRRKEFSDSKLDDYRRGHSYWVSDLEGGKVYATDSWGTRDTETGDYYEGRGYNWVNFEGQNPRYPESMREVSSYELQQM